MVSGARPNIYEQQAANKRNTILVMALFVIFVGLLGLGLDVFFLGLGDWLPVPVGTIVALAIGGMSAYASLNEGARKVLASSGATPVAPETQDHRQLTNVVEEMSIAAGLPVPALYVIPDDDPNAFATGKDPDHAAIAVTEGLLTHLNRDELQGVVAHEMSHIRSMDIRLMTVVAALVGSVMLIAEFGLRSMRMGGGRKRSSGRGGGNALVFVVWLLALLLAPLIARLLAMAVSRRREYLADASAAELTRNPAALASALEKIHAATAPTRSIKKGTAHLCIADPLGRSVNEREGPFADLFATHPPMAKRIMYLKAMAFITA